MNEFAYSVFKLSFWGIPKCCIYPSEINDISELVNEK